MKRAHRWCRVALALLTWIPVSICAAASSELAQPSAAAAGPPLTWDDSARAAIDALLLETADAQSVPDVALAIVQDGALVHSVALRRGERQAADAAPLRFQVGSVSKPVAALAALALVAEGRLALDEPVFSRVQDWSPPAATFERDGVTLRRLLSHTAGLSLGGYIGFPADSPLPTARESLAGASVPAGPVRLFQAPGAAFSYSGGGYTLMQHLLETVAEQPFEEVVRQRVLAPVGMRDSGYAAQVSGAHSLVPHDARGRPLPTYGFAALAAAGLWSTADDLARLAIFLLDAEPEAVITPALRAALATPVETDAGPAPTGLGVFVQDGGRVIGHSGSNVGWKARLELAPEFGAAIVVLTNGEAGAVVAETLTCAWARTLDPTLLADRCGRWQASRDRADRWRSVSIAMVLGLLTLLCVRVVVARGRLQPRAGRLRIGLAVLVFGLAAVGGVGLYSGLGARVLAGVPVPADTIGFAAQPLRATLNDALLALVLLAVNLLLVAQRAASAPASLSDQS